MAASRAWRVAGALLLLALVVRLVAAAFVPLLAEEAYYWLYAQHPALSYFDHPPMVAWLIRGGVIVVGDSELGVRIGGQLVMLAASGFTYLLGREWFGRREGLIAALMLQALPLYFVTGFLATMDGALLCAWAAALVGLSWALRRGWTWGWYLAGLGLGLAMLSKYTAAFLALGAVLAVLGRADWRRQLRSVHPWLAALLALAIFSPVLAWNAQHDWASFRFQLFDRFEDQALSVRRFGTFVLIQSAVLTPLFVVASIVTLLRFLRRRWLPARWWFALATGAPLIALMAYKSFATSIHVNWTLPVFLPLLPGLAHTGAVIARARSVRRKRAAADWEAITVSIFAAAHVVFLGYLVLVEPGLRLLRAIDDPTQLALAIDQERNRLANDGNEPMVIASGRYRLASRIAFYGRHLDDEATSITHTTSKFFIGGQGLAFPFWSAWERWLGDDCILIDEDGGEMLDLAKGSFDTIERINDPRVTAAGCQMAIGRRYRGPADRLPRSPAS